MILRLFLAVIAAIAAIAAMPAGAQALPRYYAVAISDAGGIGGVISYTIGADGKLDGRFALHAGDGRIERETASPRRRGALTGVYDTRGVSQGEAYTGVMTIALLPGSELYRLSWDNGDHGVAIRNGQMLTVAFGYGADTVGMMWSAEPDLWSLAGIGWRKGATHRVGLGWLGNLRGNQYPRPFEGGPSQPLLIEANGASVHLFFDDGSYGVAIPVAAPPLEIKASPARP